MMALKYVLFAIISTALNLLFQFISFEVYSGAYSLYVGMLVGTLVGLVCKYVLDKKYIFYHTSKNKTQHAMTFIAYSATGVFTTAIFWGTEIAFDRIFEHESARYFGAVIGLSIGYVTKYLLDKLFVFSEVKA